MKTIKLGNREINIEGSALTPYFHKKEFKESMSSHLVNLYLVATGDKRNLDEMAVLQLAWAMEKTANVGTNNTIKGFESWLGELGKIDVYSVFDDVLEVAMDAIFHGAVEESDGEGDTGEL